MEYQITKRTLLKKGLLNNREYLIFIKLFNSDKTRFRRFKLVLWFDSFDVEQTLDREVKNYKNDCLKYINITVDNLISNTVINYDNFGDFKDICNNSILEYNNRNR